ncbi:septum formation family protein [Mycobacterium sp. WMMD1722]|uniref:septum formation family protein n=1 Tax=Mycobacterium sp. WMMD1722 TaxID=3404117 RepID=UPI003BF586EC
MEPMLEAPERDDQAPDGHNGPAGRAPWWHSLQAASTRRALLLTALGGLLIAGVITALPISQGADGSGLAASAISLGPRGNATFNHAKSGDCLTWPDRDPDSAEIVDCAAEHRFEVAQSVDMRTFPGSEYGPDAAPPSPARIQQISQEQCQAAVRRYLGPRFDPNSRFTISMLWSGDKAWRQSGERRMLCGLQLPGPNNQQIAFTGKVADIDQSKVWPAGTCLGIDPTTNQPTDIPVDCAAPHAMEVTGSVNLAERFPAGLPPEPEQDTFIKDTCTKLTDAYLAPIQLRNTTLTLIYSTVSLPSWSAGSRQVSCSIGATLGNGGWSTLLNSAKGPLQINGQPPVPPPDIPEERLNLPPIPMPDAVDSSSQLSDESSAGTTSDQSQETGVPHVPVPTTTPTATSSAPAPAATETPAPTEGAPPGQGNTFLNGPPPAPAAPAPPGPPAAQPLPPPPAAPAPPPPPGPPADPLLPPPPAPAGP